MGYDPLDQYGFPISALEELDRMNGPRFGRVGSIPQDILDKVAADGAAYRKNRPAPFGWGQKIGEQK